MVNRTAYIRNGVLDPWSTVGKGVISEHVVFKVLDDCVKCNTLNSFNMPYDLISKKYDIINVKTATLRSYSNTNKAWMFEIRANQYTPDHYICLGFDENYRNIIKVWIVPNSANIIKKGAIYISMSNYTSKRAKQYEVDPKLYNEVYQTFDILELPEFRNLNLAYNVE